MLYVGSTQGKLVAIDLASYKPAWSYETDGMKRDRAVYTKADGTPNGDAIYPSDSYDGMVAGVARVTNMGAIISSPVVADSVVYVGSADGNLYALQ